MKPWVAYAIVSMVFAGVTSVIAKLGLAGISGELGIAVRTCFVFVFVLAFLILKEQITTRTLLGASLMVAGLLIIVRK